MIETVIPGAEFVTVIVANADLVVSAALVAVTVNVPVVLGAVYMPEEEMVPEFADQVTVVLLVPVTLAENCCVPPTCTVALEGFTATATPPGGVVVVRAVLPQPQEAKIKTNNAKPRR